MTTDACPHCGQAGFVRVKRWPWEKEGEPGLVWGYHVICDASGIDAHPRGCGASSGWGETQAEAIAAWNRRAAPQPAQVAVKPLEWSEFRRPAEPPPAGFDAVDLDMIKSGDRLGPALGQRVFDALSRATRAEERIAEMDAALAEAEDVFALVEHPAFPDPVHHDRVKALGREIGFGALMATASAGWREVMAEKGYPLGGEFVAGPCHGTVVSVLEIIRRARAIRTRGE